MDSRSPLCRICCRQIVDWHSWGPTTSNCLWPPRSPGYSLLFVNYDHWSSIRKPVCVVLVLNTCGESRSSAFGVGRLRSQKTFFGMPRLSQNRFSQNDLQQNHFSLTLCGLSVLVYPLVHSSWRLTKSLQAIAQLESEHLRETLHVLLPKTSWWLICWQDLAVFFVCTVIILWVLCISL